jgi:hypothetical protein
LTAPRVHAHAILIDRMSTLRLENHCKRRLDPGRHAWAVGCGFVRTAWIDDTGALLDVAPRPGESRRVYVEAPFEAARGEPFHVLWEPALAAMNGWDEECRARLSDVRIVECRFVEVLGATARAAGWSPGGGFYLRVDVLDSFDPMRIEPCTPDVEVPLSAWPFGASRPQTLGIWRTSDRILVTGSVEGDVNVDLLVDSNVERVAMLVDTSICEDFFWFGNARASGEFRAVLLGMLA